MTGLPDAGTPAPAIEDRLRGLLDGRRAEVTLLYPLHLALMADLAQVSTRTIMIAADNRDFDRANQLRAREGLRQVTKLVCDLEDPVWSTPIFDRIVALPPVWVSPRKAAACWIRMLKPGGELLVDIPVGPRDASVTHALARLVGGPVLALEEWKALLERGGLAIEALVPSRERIRLGPDARAALAELGADQREVLAPSTDAAWSFRVSLRCRKLS